MLDSSIFTEWPFKNKPSAGTWSPIFKHTTSPTTILNIEVGCRRPSRTTSTCMLELSSESFENCWLCLKLLMAETARTSTTATMILPPSYHPSFGPCCLIPNPSDKAAQTRRIIMVESLNASTRKLMKLLLATFCMEKGFNIMVFTSNGINIDGNVRIIRADQEAFLTSRFLRQRGDEVDCPKNDLQPAAWLPSIIGFGMKHDG